MGKLFDKLNSDVRFIEGIKACINCGTCTAICPAAEVYDYQPRNLVAQVQTRDDEVIEELLRGDTIWYCGECMSCKTRCPRQNAPGLVVQALRKLSIETGLFVESEKGRQQLALKRIIGETILATGYCVHFDHMNLDVFPEQGPVWQWVRDNRHEVLAKVGANYKGTGLGALRLMPKEDLDELYKIFEVTGGNKWFEKIEKDSEKKAGEMGLDYKEGNESPYFKEIFTKNNQEKHTRS